MCGLTLFFLFGIVLLFEMGESQKEKKQVKVEITHATTSLKTRYANHYLNDQV